MNEAQKQLALPYLEIEVRHLPSQTELLVKMLTEFIAGQGEDPTGLALHNLCEAAKDMRKAYERLETMLQPLDKQERRAERRG